MIILKNNISKILITTIILGLFLITISSVNAAEHNITNTTAGGLNRSVVDANNEDTINLQEGIYKNNVTNVIINKNLTIQGKNPQTTIIDAQKIGRIFHITTGNTLTLINITLTNGTTIDDGGAIWNDGNLIITNSRLINNVATTFGGAIHNQNHCLVIITDSYFANNNADYGGAIYANNTDMTINNSIFENNTANTSGGSIYTVSTNLTMKNSKFLNNIAKLAVGGSIYHYNGYLTLDSSIFENNTATTNGGGIFSIVSNLTLNNSNFTNNKATNGGAIEHVIGKLKIDNSNFVTNLVGQSGGAILIFNNETSINNSNFTNNTALTGGAIYNIGDNTHVNNSLFMGNKAGTNGGGSYNGGNMSVSNNTMVGNTAGNLGNVIYNVGNMGTLNLTYIDNSTWYVKRGQVITLYANLTDDRGNPITGQNISFYINGTFIDNVTVIEGIASINYTVLQNVGVVPVTGNYSGRINYPLILLNGTLNITPLVNVTIVKTVNVTSVANGQTFTYTITVNNRGPNNATNVTVNDILPAGVVYVSSSPSTGTYNNATGIWNIGTLNNDSTATLTITVRASRSGNVTNRANVTVINTTSNQTNVNNQTNASMNVTVTPAVNLTLTKLASAKTVVNGQTITYTIVVSNNGPDNATNVVVNEILPSSLIYLGDDSNGTYNPTTGVWNIGNLNNGNTVTLVITVRVNATTNGQNTTVINGVNVTSDQDNINNETNNTNIIENITVNPSVNLTLTKSANVTGNISKGEKITYTITVTNNGPNDANNVQLTEFLPSSLVLLSSSHNLGSWDPVTGLWGIENLANGQTATLIINVLVNGTGTISNFANLTTDDNNTGNNNTNVTITAKLKTNTTINVPSKVKIGETVTISGILYDQAGNPVPNAQLTVTVDNKIYTVITDAEGKWSLQYKTTQLGTIQIIASFAGTELYFASENVTSFNVKATNLTNETQSNETYETNWTNENANNPIASSAMKKTGIPIIVILILLLTTLGLIYRKK